MKETLVKMEGMDKDEQKEAMTKLIVHLIDGKYE